MDEDDFELNNLLNQIDSENNLISLQTLIFLTRNNRVNNRIRRNQIRRNQIRKRINPMIEFNRMKFKKRFRFYKDEVEYLYRLIDGPRTLEPEVCFLMLISITNIFKCSIKCILGHSSGIHFAWDLETSYCSTFLRHWNILPSYRRYVWRWQKHCSKICVRSIILDCHEIKKSLYHNATDTTRAA